MKKIILFIAIITFAFVLCSCSGEVQAAKSDPISAVQTGLLVGSNSNFLVKVIYGKIEDPEKTDGVVGNLKNYAVLEVTPLKLNLIDKKYTYELGGKKGELVPNDIRLYFKNVISDMTEEQLKALTSIKICFEDDSEEIELTNAMVDFIKTENIIAAAKSEFADFVTQNTVNDKPNYEIMLKLVNSKHNPASPYYWYVTFANKTSSVAAVIDPFTGKILAKK